MKTDKVKPMTPDEQTFHDGAMIFAMQGILQNSADVNFGEGSYPEATAAISVKIADALLAARRARKEAQP